MKADWTAGPLHSRYKNSMLLHSPRLPLSPLHPPSFYSTSSSSPPPRGVSPEGSREVPPLLSSLHSWLSSSGICGTLSWGPPCRLSHSEPRTGLGCSPLLRLSSPSLLSSLLLSASCLAVPGSRLPLQPATLLLSSAQHWLVLSITIYLLPGTAVGSHYI